jgi:electron transfer flavoprotein alpha subunit
MPDSGNAIMREGVMSKLNPADMFAIEEAIRIKEMFGGNVTGLCMGVSSAASALKGAIAMGIDNIYLLSDRVFSGADTFATAYTLASGIKYIGVQDLILCGKQSTDGDTGQVGQEVAALLNLPCITNVVEIQIEKDKILTCRILGDEGYFYLQTELPAVVCVLKGINEPRIPTISGLQKAQITDVNFITHQDITIDIKHCGLVGSPTRVKRTSAHRFAKRASIDITNEYAEQIGCLIAQVRFADNMVYSGSTLQSSFYKDGHEVWVVPEFSDGKITVLSLEVMSKARELSLDGNYALSALVLAALEENIIEQLRKYGVDKIYAANFQFSHFSESQASTIVNSCIRYKPSVLLFGGSVWGKWIAPNVAAQLQAGLTADCINLSYDEDGKTLLHTRIAFGGRLRAEVYIPTARPQMATIRKGVFSNVPRPSENNPLIIDVSNMVDTRNRIEFLTRNNTAPNRTNLSDANIIIAGGKGVGKENFPHLFRLSKLTGGAVGATRYAVDARWIDYEYQIGQTGVTVRPRIFIAFGISGASEHLVGMRDADCIVSINTDTHAPITAVSDYRVTANCKDVLTALIQHFERMEKTL